jgi:hypothetical protein
MTQHQSVAIPTEWVVVKESQAAKLSGRAQGLRTYRVGYPAQWTMLKTMWKIVRAGEARFQPRIWDHPFDKL